MKTKVVTSIAERHIDAIIDYLDAGSPQSADRYESCVWNTFFNFSENDLPRRASPRLPQDIRTLSVSGFRGYTLRLLFRGDHIALVAAFRPGLSEAMQDSEIKRGVDAFRREYE